MKLIAKVSRITIIAALVIALLICGTAAIYLGVAGHIFRIKQSYVPDISVQLSEGAEVKNTILMIGDGMGANHIKAGKAFYGIDTLYMETLQIDGLVTTYSKTGTTDSAAAATALSTGRKIHNGGIAMEGGKNIETLGEYALKQGKSVGIITTEGVNGATPSGFSAHAEIRSDTKNITNTQLASGIDLFMGANKTLYDTYEYQITDAGYDYVTAYDQLSYTTDKIFAAFESIATSDGTNITPQLSSLVDFAIDYLSAKSENGYFLMIEGAHIDKRSHANDMDGMLKQFKAFDEAIGTVIDKVQADTFVMITADHETGSLQYNGEKGEAINNSLFKSGGHTNKDVRYFATSQITNLPTKIDNTNIALIFRQLIAG